MQYLAMTQIVSDEVNFSHAKNFLHFLQFDTIFFYGFGQAYLKYPDKFAISLLYLQKEARSEVNFLHTGKHQSLP